MSEPAATDVFISYTRGDGDFVDKLEPDLKAHGCNVWIDRSKLEGGQVWTSEIREAIERCQIVFVVLSPDAVASRSVRREWQHALQHGKRVIPLLYHPCKIPRPLRRLHWIEMRAGANFEATYGERLPSVLRAIAAPPTIERSRLRSLLTSNVVRAGLVLVILLSLLSGILFWRTRGPSTPPYGAMWNGQLVTLKPVPSLATSLDQQNGFFYRGFVTGFTTLDKDYQCIQRTPADKVIPVYTAPDSYSWPAQSGMATYVMRVVCSNGFLSTWTFEARAPTPHIYHAMWQGKDVALVVLPHVPAALTALDSSSAKGQVTGFSTDDQAYTCIEGTSLNVYSGSTSLQSQYLVFDTCRSLPIYNSLPPFAFTFPIPSA